MRSTRYLTSIVLLCSAFNLNAGDGEEHPLFSDEWLFRIGGQEADANVKAGLANPSLGEIPLIDLKAGGGNTTVTSFWGNVLWQGPERWSFGISYFQAEADANKTSVEDFTFGDITIPAGTGFTADFTTDFYVLNAFYDFYQEPDTAAGVGMGIYALDLGVSAQVVVGGEATGMRESADTLAPLPTLSAYYKHAFNDKWAMMADVGWLSVKIGDYDGDVLAARVSAEYWFNDSWGLGAGYTYVDLDLSVEDTIFTQKYKVEYDSVFFFATFGIE